MLTCRGVSGTLRSGIRPPPAIKSALKQTVAQLVGKGNICSDGIINHGRVPQECKGRYLVLVVDTASRRLGPLLP